MFTNILHAPEFIEVELKEVIGLWGLSIILTKERGFGLQQITGK